MLSPPRVLSIAGSDPSGGAGIQGDLKTMHSMGCYGMAVLTALTAQNTVGVRDVHVPPVEFVDAQISAIVEDCPPAVTKTGMLYSAGVIELVAAWAERGALGRLVLDPVMVATSGDSLLRADACTALRNLLLPLAEVVTPNLVEAEALLGLSVEGVDGAVEAAQSLARELGAWVLVKGGHAPGDGDLVDVLAGARGELKRWEHRRLPIGASHGTGCTLSAALAAGLANGLSMFDAVGGAIEYVQRGLATAFAVGAGAWPVNHLRAAEWRTSA